MLCKKCGTECVENARFCGNCGTRLDGKVACKSCGELNEDTFTYCVYCGKRLDGKKSCEKCGTLYTGRFCSACGFGTIGKTYQTDKPVERVDQETGKSNVFAKVFDISASVFALIAVICALIFVFFIGVAPITTGISTAKDTSETIFYYFGKYQKETKAILATYKNSIGTAWFFEQVKTSFSCIGAFGLIIGILALVSVGLFATMTIIVCVRNFLGYSHKRADKWAIACVMSFIASAFAFCSLHTVLFDMQTGFNLEQILDEIGLYGLENANIGLSKTTKAGIILCAIFLGLFFVSRCVSMWKKFFNLKTGVLALLTCVGVAFASVVLSLAKTTGVSWEILVETISLDVIFSSEFFNSTFLILFAQASNDMSIFAYQDYTIAIETMAIFNTLAQILVFFTIFCSAFTLRSLLRRIYENKGNIDWSILTVLCTIGLLVCTIIAQVQFRKACEFIGNESEMSMISPSYTKQICLVVFSILMLVVEIVLVKFKEKPELIEPFKDDDYLQ